MNKVDLCNNIEDDIKFKDGENLLKGFFVKLILSKFNENKFMEIKGSGLLFDSKIMSDFKLLVDSKIMNDLKLLSVLEKSSFLIYFYNDEDDDIFIMIDFSFGFSMVDISN